MRHTTCGGAPIVQMLIICAMLTLLAPAKLNLFLHITGRRPDGYHLLQSVFMRIDWCDSLHIAVTERSSVTRQDIGNATGQALPAVDLSVRAAAALQTAMGVRQGAHIALDKRIPSEAGMGGGSSDAAVTLLALNQLWQTKLSVAQLAHIALPLGADVPFFLHQSHAWVEGIGERITPIALPAAHFLVVKPDAGISTAQLFSSSQLKRDAKPVTMEGFAAWSASTTRDVPQQRLDRFGCNQLQPLAQELCPPMAQTLKWFAQQGLTARMTGSGSAVFAQVPADFDLLAAPSLPAGWHVKLCTNVVPAMKHV